MKPDCIAQAFYFPQQDFQKNLDQQLNQKL